MFLSKWYVILNVIIPCIHAADSRRRIRESTGLPEQTNPNYIGIQKE